MFNLDTLTSSFMNIVPNEEELLHYGVAFVAIMLGSLLGRLSTRFITKSIFVLFKNLFQGAYVKGFLKPSQA